MKTNQTKIVGGGSSAYEAPFVEVAEIRVEQGFAASSTWGDSLDGNLGWEDIDLPDWF